MTVREPLIHSSIERQIGKFVLCGRFLEWPWRGAPEYGEVRAERNSVFARIWRNVIKSTIFSMIVLLCNQTVLCVILGDLT